MGRGEGCVVVVVMVVVVVVVVVVGVCVCVGGGGGGNVWRRGGAAAVCPAALADSAVAAEMPRPPSCNKRQPDLCPPPPPLPPLAGSSVTVEIPGCSGRPPVGCNIVPPGM